MDMAGAPAMSARQRLQDELMTIIDAGTQAGHKLQVRTVDLDGQVLRAGIRPGRDAGPPLLVFNGIGANFELLQPFVDALPDIEVILFDVPGVGGSPAPLMPYRFSSLCVLADRLLSRLGYDGQVDALGVSWGGALAQEFARLHAHRCRRLVLAATSPGVIMVPGRLSVLTKMIGLRRYTDPQYLRRVGADLYGGALRHDPAWLDQHGRHMQPPRGRGYLYQLLAAWGWSSLPWLGALKQPTLVMHGTDDPIVPPVNARILAAAIPHAALQLVDDGHLFLVTGAESAASTIGRFLRA
ncbi:Poly(3-hydroxyalkanoate) depolymerase (PHA depolymerase)(PHB depolymerase) [Cupriavidus taiwanensis]|nr:Poly(3-hydroxyalkanoate) depolymerase (PHA depolymerase)(PHB depolymerase) [Cupriavidus taiwanensis]SOZ31195.1 Poly(3-hydroxyalkanoate) depolymerase (PHA depolymerase)(PHB depolymerase) [Cupriavidus taiwanensis]SOZ47272.1 Poly(3-hydroxyalkanoate) depolymerase (PHA depolymerase)(PHB depolymerase) [Cupriavidus taiwanensis]SPA02178.1 Poly(3-hydroxyalkanoate) depolymerase (PHA depolymerase)(PHB depolymerase) [Cupriavidus taiwanensis]